MSVAVNMGYGSLSEVPACATWGVGVSLGGFRSQGEGAKTPDSDWLCGTPLWTTVTETHHMRWWLLRAVLGLF